MRNKSLDSLKFVLIILVVLGHFLEPSRYSNKLSCDLYSVIYAFHMPLFVMLSGYFTKTCTIEKFKRQFFLLLETFIILTVLTSLFTYGIVRLRDFYRLTDTSSWYILSLITWRAMILFGMFMVKSYSKMTILCGVIVLSYISYVFVNRNENCFAFMRTMQFFPFFVMGYLCDERLLSKISFGKNKVVLMVLSLFAVLGILSFSGRNLHILEFQRSGILSIMNAYQCSYIYALLLKAVLFGVQIILCCTILLLFLRLPKSFVEFLSLYGNRTLLVYFLQAIATKALTYHMQLSFWSAFPFCILLIIIGLCIAKNKVLSSFILNPISRLYVVLDQIINRKNLHD